RALPAGLEPTGHPDPGGRYGEPEGREQPGPGDRPAQGRGALPARPAGRVEDGDVGRDDPAARPPGHGEQPSPLRRPEAAADRVVRNPEARGGRVQGPTAGSAQTGPAADES